jgi:hypothetical protein
MIGQCMKLPRSTSRPDVSQYFCSDKDRGDIFNDIFPFPTTPPENIGNCSGYYAVVLDIIYIIISVKLLNKLLDVMYYY